jgi:hypothetical protein
LISAPDPVLAPDLDLAPGYVLNMPFSKLKCPFTLSQKVPILFYKLIFNKMNLYKNETTITKV